MALRLLATLALLSTACGRHTVRASGHLAHDLRDVAPYSGVSVASGIHATVEVGPQGPVEIEADDNILPEVETLVEDGTLQIRFRRGVRFFWDSGEVTVHARAPEIRYLGASGGSEIRAALGSSDELELEASGGAEVSARGIDVGQVSASGSGGSRLLMAGRAERLVLELSGGAKARAGKLPVKRAQVNGSGGSTAEVQVSEVIRGSLSGGTDVVLHGNASSRLSTSGGSEVHYDDD